ncbi:MAG: DUF3524 domain-containing protein [Thermoleophilia bacterium]|nr:DUF3524 domain-containing protein [Thermoleophilia bacterium]
MVPPAEGLRVWALEAYLGGSHAHFLSGFRQHSSHQVSVLGLPGRHWKWRMHGGALSLARRARDRVTLEPPPQVLFASSMLDLATFLSLTDPVVAAAPESSTSTRTSSPILCPPGWSATWVMVSSR